MTTNGDLPDDYEQREHDESAPAWNDYSGRILELEIHGFAREREEATAYGRKWVCDLSRGVEQISVTIERLVGTPAPVALSLYNGSERTGMA